MNTTNKNGQIVKGTRIRFIGSDVHGIPHGHTGTVKDVYSLNVWVEMDSTGPGINPLYRVTEASLRFYEFEVI